LIVVDWFIDLYNAWQVRVGEWTERRYRRLGYYRISHRGYPPRSTRAIFREMRGRQVP
jgi:hypothetical protein